VNTQKNRHRMLRSILGNPRAIQDVWLWGFRKWLRSCSSNNGENKACLSSFKYDTYIWMGGGGSCFSIELPKPMIQERPYIQTILRLVLCYSFCPGSQQGNKILGHIIL